MRIAIYFLFVFSATVCSADLIKLNNMTWKESITETKDVTYNYAQIKQDIVRYEKQKTILQRKIDILKQQVAKLQQAGAK